MRYESWVERQIREAMERGEFDNLPGAGQPIPGLTGHDEENWWVKRFLEREKIPMPLPTSLALRKEIASLPETLADVTHEDAVRAIVADLTNGSATRTVAGWTGRPWSFGRSRSRRWSPSGGETASADPHGSDTMQR